MQQQAQQQQQASQQQQQQQQQLQQQLQQGQPMNGAQMQFQVQVNLPQQAPQQTMMVSGNNNNINNINSNNNNNQQQQQQGTQQQVNRRKHAHPAHKAVSTAVSVIKAPLHKNLNQPIFARQLHEDDNWDAEKGKIDADEDILHLMLACCCCPCVVPIKYCDGIIAPCMREACGGCGFLLTCNQAWTVNKMDLAFPPWFPSMGVPDLLPYPFCCCNCPAACLMTRWNNAETMKLGNNMAGGVFTKGIAPYDVKEGGLKDHWLLSTVAALAEYPETIAALFLDQQRTKTGLYRVRLYDLPSKSWRIHTIDANVPTKYSSACIKRWYKIDEKPLFCDDMDAELWPLLLEKAFAKHVGSYWRLAEGHPAWAMEALTGEPAVCFRLRDDASFWVEDRVAYPISAKKCDAFLESTGFQTSEKGLFQRLLKWHDEKYVIAAGTAANPLRERKQGIFYSHSYTILAAKDAFGHQLVQLRNPSGKHEWKGDWSDESPLWTKHPEVAQECRYMACDEGVFWMPMRTFQEHFNVVVAVKPNPAAIPPPEKETVITKIYDPCAICCAESCIYCCMCGGCQLACIPCMGGSGTCASWRDSICNTRACAACRPMTRVNPCLVYATGNGTGPDMANPLSASAAYGERGPLSMDATNLAGSPNGTPSTAASTPGHAAQAPNQHTMEASPAAAPQNPAPQGQPGAPAPAPAPAPAVQAPAQAPAPSQQATQPQPQPQTPAPQALPPAPQTLPQQAPVRPGVAPPAAAPAPAPVQAPAPAPAQAPAQAPVQQPAPVAMQAPVQTPMPQPMQAPPMPAGKSSYSAANTVAVAQNAQRQAAARVGMETETETEMQTQTTHMEANGQGQSFTQTSTSTHAHTHTRQQAQAAQSQSQSQSAIATSAAAASSSTAPPPAMADSALQHAMRAQEMLHAAPPVENQMREGRFVQTTREAPLIIGGTPPGAQLTDSANGHGWGVVIEDCHVEVASLMRMKV